jgi:hypothetical protein
MQKKPLRHEVLPGFNRLILKAAQAYERSQTISVVASSADDLRAEYERRQQESITARMELAQFVMINYAAIRIDLMNQRPEQRADLPTKGATS